MDEHTPKEKNSCAGKLSLSLEKKINNNTLLFQVKLCDTVVTKLIHVYLPVKILSWLDTGPGAWLCHQRTFLAH